MRYYASTSDGRDWDGAFPTLERAKDAAKRIARNSSLGECLVCDENKEPVGVMEWTGNGFEYESL